MGLQGGNMGVRYVRAAAPVFPAHFGVSLKRVLFGAKGRVC